MDDNSIGKLLSDNSVLGASVAAAMAMLYKVWQILKKDRKEDNLDNAERSLRDELRQEVVSLRAINDKLREENNVLHQDVAELKAAFKICQVNRPSICPLVQLGISRNRITSQGGSNANQP